MVFHRVAPATQVGSGSEYLVDPGHSNQPGKGWKWRCLHKSFGCDFFVLSPGRIGFRPFHALLASRSPSGQIGHASWFQFVRLVARLAYDLIQSVSALRYLKDR
jgi:hypothetical protein